MRHFPSENTQGFASLLYVIFHLEGRHKVERIAPALDVAPSTLYEYCTGRRIFPPDLIAPLYRALGDRRILEFFCNEAEVIFHELPECAGDPDLTLLEQAVHAQERFCEVLRATMRALKDHRISRQELAEIEAHYYATQAQLAQLLACVRAAHRKPREG